MDIVISSQPSTWEASASSTSQPSDGHAGPSRKSRSARPSTAAATVAPTVACSSGATTEDCPAPPGALPLVACRSKRMYAE